MEHMSKSRAQNTCYAVAGIGTVIRNAPIFPPALTLFHSLEQVVSMRQLQTRKSMKFLGADSVCRCQCRSAVARPGLPRLTNTISRRRLGDSKSGKPRSVPLNDEGLAYLEIATAGKRSDELMFTRADADRYIQHLVSAIWGVQ